VEVCILIGYSCSDMTSFTFSPIVRRLCFVSAVALLSGKGIAQQATTAQTAPKTDTSFIDSDGTAHVTRVVPVPKTISPEAQARLARPASDANVPQTLEQRRAGTDKWQIGAGEKSRAIYPVKIESQTIAGVPVRVVDPIDAAPMHPDRVLINLHGGGFNSDSGSFTESIPIANLAHTRVIAVLYRLAPEHPFPAAVDDVVAVYREMLKTYKPANIGIYGTSAGAILTGEVAVKFKQLGLPLPGALGIFSGMGDFSLLGDSFAMYALNGLSGHLDIPGPARDTEYVGTTDPKDPVLSPMYADVHGFPPTLFITSGRDLLLSGTTTMHRAFLRAGVDAQLIEFEGLSHAFWNDVSLPESKEAYGYMADFFSKELGK
jgi:monoterpene epsilon-lactone hydrolase